MLRLLFANFNKKTSKFLTHTKELRERSNYLNCAAPKSVLVKNCNIIKELQRDYPPFPSDVGLYQTSNQSQPSLRPRTLELQQPLTVKLKKHPGILKNYKSCPVSPVHEETEWCNSQLIDGNAGQDSLNPFVEPKRHSLYSDDARSIFDMIHTDTEKMIAEIKLKYGDLDDLDTVDSAAAKVESPTRRPPITGPVNKTIENLKYTALKEKNEHGFLSEEDGNYSSDSLEDCSLDLDSNNKSKKLVCKKHKKSTLPLPPPKRSVSDYFIYDEFYTTTRKVSLSDILNDDDNHFLETQRHSSASFFLGQQYPDSKSQESIISDEYSGFGGGGVSYCNSMESILSDESECKSAPLEVLFGRGIRKDIPRYSINLDKIDNTSKSYGSSPNATIGFDYFMDNQYCDRDFYDVPRLGDYRNTRSPTYYDKPLPTSSTYPRLSAAIANHNDDEFIPSLTVKNAQYSTSMTKSLSKEFANQRQQSNTNPLLSCDGSELFVRKPMKQPSSITRSDIFGGVDSSSASCSIKKSCSFEIQLDDGYKTPKSIKRFEQNLEKFNRDRRTFGGTLEMDYVPHKPPVASRRSSSMRSKNKPKMKEKYNTVGQMNASGKKEGRDFVNKEYQRRGGDDASGSGGGGERSFDLYVAEKGISEDDNMDSLEVFPKLNLRKENSVDSLDDILTNEKYHDVPRASTFDNFIDSNLMSSVEYTKFRDIEKKIDVINKLVELEEKKLENERIIKENRMRPFNCDLSQKGYVKNLTQNFDKLARAAQLELDVDRPRNMNKIKRNYSLPDVLEGAKIKTFEFTDRDLDLELDSNIVLNIEGSNFVSLECLLKNIILSFCMSGEWSRSSITHRRRSIVSSFIFFTAFLFF